MKRVGFGSEMIQVKGGHFFDLHPGGPEALTEFRVMKEEIRWRFFVRMRHITLSCNGGTKKWLASGRPGKRSSRIFSLESRWLFAGEFGFDTRHTSLRLEAKPSTCYRSFMRTEMEEKALERRDRIAKIHDEISVMAPNLVLKAYRVIEEILEGEEKPEQMAQVAVAMAKIGQNLDPASGKSFHFHFGSIPRPRKDVVDVVELGPIPSPEPQGIESRSESREVEGPPGELGKKEDPLVEPA